ncbi:MAG: class I SAM-dependent RNA methyltransferase [Clostridiales bacterium]|nr:class I SAM-dependent RNA methyltransferase [Clostridiales bacterium]
MKKGQIYEGVVEKVKFPNKGIISRAVLVPEAESKERTDLGKTPVEECFVTVKNTIPGQRVRFAVTKKRSGKADGRLLEVLEHSPEELEEPACPHFGVCGGCNYQTLPYEEQLQLKSAQVLALMREVVPNAENVFEGIKASPRQFGYRNKMEFTFGDAYRDGPLTVGMHKRGGFYDIVTVDQCRIVDEDYRQILAATEAFFREKRTPYYHRMRHEGYLRHLLVRKAVKTGEILVDLITTTQKTGGERTGTLRAAAVGEVASEAVRDKDVRNIVPELERNTVMGGTAPETAREQNAEAEKVLLDGWVQTLLSLNLTGTIAGILHTKNDSPADAVKNEGTEILYGQDYFYEELLGLKFRITPFSFFQTNSLGAEVLYETARGFIRDAFAANDQSLEGKTVFDLYSGTGTIAQMLASVSGKVVGVEIVEEAVEAARQNAAENGIANCEFIAGDVLKVLDEVEEKPDFIVLDPPRDGVHPKALEKIIRYGVEKMIYISCKPTSLQRDLAVLQERGYRVERMCCIDLFPGTVHCETVVALSQRKPDDYIEVDLYLDELDATSAELKATYVEIKDYVLKEFGLKVSSLYISQVKRKCGLEVGPNYNHAKTDNVRVPQCPPEKEEAIRAALKHFAMIKE